MVRFFLAPPLHSPHGPGMGPLIKKHRAVRKSRSSRNMDLSRTLHGLAITEISIYWTDKRPHVGTDGGWKPKILRNWLCEGWKGPGDVVLRHSIHDEMVVEELLWQSTVAERSFCPAVSHTITSISPTRGGRFKSRAVSQTSEGGWWYLCVHVCRTIFIDQN